MKVAMTASRAAEIAERISARLLDLSLDGVGGIKPDHLQVVKNHYGDWELHIDVPIGGLVLPLSAEDWLLPNNAQAGGMGLPDLICARVVQATRSRRVIGDRMLRVRTMAEAALDRADAGMRIIDLSLARTRMLDSFQARFEALELRIEVLDHSLRPCVNAVTVYTGRDAARAIRTHATPQRALLRRRASLERQGAACAMSVITRNVVEASRLSVGEVARRLLSGEEKVILSDLASLGGETSVYLRAGRMVTFCKFGKAALLWDRELTMFDELPELAKLALKGKPATAIIDHPALRGTCASPPSPDPAGDAPISG